jgi:transposase InsO family protein
MSLHRDRDERSLPAASHRLGVAWIGYIGSAMSERMTADLACNALRMALWRRKQPAGVIAQVIGGVGIARR